MTRKRNNLEGVGENDFEDVLDIEELNERTENIEDDEDHELTFEDAIKSTAEGRSACCKAPIDLSRVIKDGRHKGHGPRLCSKCKKVLFMV